MNKEIKYGGYSANPNDHESVEGDLAVAMNLIPEDATIKPVLPPGIELSLPLGMKLLAIHDTSSFPGKHYILQDENNALYWWSGDDSDNVELIIAEFQDVFKLEPIGNTLVTLADEGMDYFLWKNGKYINLGSKMPEITLSFSLGEAYPEKSDPVYLDNNWEYYDGRSAKNNFSSEDKTEYNNRLHGAIAKMINERITGEGAFCMPFFIRYALRLYDESVTMHSAPILMLPDGLSTSVEGYPVSHVYVTAKKSFLQYEAHIDGDMELWEDVIKGVSVYISAPLWTYEAAKNLDRVYGGYYKTKSVSRYKWSNDPFVVHPEMVYDGVDDAAIPQFEKSRVIDSIVNCAQFYLVNTIKIDDLAENRADLATPGYILQSLVNREVMTDYGSHSANVPKVAFAYNGRLNIANISQRVFDGYDPFGDFIYSEKTNSGTVASPSTVKVRVEIVKDGRTFVVEKESAQEWPLDKNGVCWFFYPDASATRAWLYIDGDCYYLPLKEHETLNGAYYFSFDGPAEAEDDAPSLTTDNIIRSTNKLLTSEVNNPFLFSSSGTNTVGTGDINGLCAAVRPVSTGQMGYADLYIFADSGIWTAKINEKGTYSNITLATGDVCINPDSITQMETAVLFTTDRGIMLISGSQSQCISDAIDDKGQADAGMSGHVGTMAGLQGLGTVAVGPFREYMRSCSMLYDYEGQRVFVYNRAYSYAYIYSLESHKWGMTQSNIDYTVRAYPAAMAVTRSGHLVNYSEPADVNVVHSMLVTRPLSLELPDVLKTVTDVLQRGLFSKRAGHVKSVLLASNDMLEWRIIQTSTDEDLRGYRGTPYKWFRVALLLDLAPGESVTGCSVQFDTKYTNRLR